MSRDQVQTRAYINTETKYILCDLKFQSRLKYVFVLLGCYAALIVTYRPFETIN
jgi:hypothetical protein